MWTGSKNPENDSTNFLERESGDGDSGAEYKDPLDSTENFEEVKNALRSITREVQGAEKPKDFRKSKIPLRKKEKSPVNMNYAENGITVLGNFPENRENQTPFGNFPEDTFCYDEMDLSKNSSSEFDPSQFVETSFKEISYEEFMNYSEEDLTFNLVNVTMNSQYLEKTCEEMPDIYRDLEKFQGSSTEDTTENSLSPRAPLAQEDFILEAPEEFRSPNSSLGNSPEPLENPNFFKHLQDPVETQEDDIDFRTPLSTPEKFETPLSTFDFKFGTENELRSSKLVLNFERENLNQKAPESCRKKLFSEETLDQNFDRPKTTQSKNLRHKNLNNPETESFQKKNSKELNEDPPLSNLLSGECLTENSSATRISELDSDNLRLVCTWGRVRTEVDSLERDQTETRCGEPTVRDTIQTETEPTERNDCADDKSDYNHDDLKEANASASASGGDSIGNYHKQQQQQHEPLSSEVRSDLSHIETESRLAFNLLKGRVAMKILTDTPNLKICENLQHLTNFHKNKQNQPLNPIQSDLEDPLSVDKKSQTSDPTAENIQSDLEDPQIDCEFLSVSKKSRTSDPTAENIESDPRVFKSVESELELGTKKSDISNSGIKSVVPIGTKICSGKLSVENHFGNVNSVHSDPEDLGSVPSDFTDVETSDSNFFQSGSDIGNHVLTLKAQEKSSKSVENSFQSDSDIGNRVLTLTAQENSSKSVENSFQSDSGIGNHVLTLTAQEKSSKSVGNSFQSDSDIGNQVLTSTAQEKSSKSVVNSFQSDSDIGNRVLTLTAPENSSKSVEKFEKSDLSDQRDSKTDKQSVPKSVAKSDFENKKGVQNSVPSNLPPKLTESVQSDTRTLKSDLSNSISDCPSVNKNWLHRPEIPESVQNGPQAKLKCIPSDPETSKSVPSNLNGKKSVLPTLEIPKTSPNESLRNQNTSFHEEDLQTSHLKNPQPQNLPNFFTEITDFIDDSSEETDRSLQSITNPPTTMEINLPPKPLEKDLIDKNRSSKILSPTKNSDKKISSDEVVDLPCLLKPLVIGSPIKSPEVLGEGKNLVLKPLSLKNSPLHKGQDEVDFIGRKNGIKRNLERSFGFPEDSKSPGNFPKENQMGLLEVSGNCLENSNFFGENLLVLSNVDVDVGAAVSVSEIIESIHFRDASEKRRSRDQTFEVNGTTDQKNIFQKNQQFQNAKSVDSDKNLCSQKNTKENLLSCDNQGANKSINQVPQNPKDQVTNKNQKSVENNLQLSGKNSQELLKNPCQNFDPNVAQKPVEEVICTKTTSYTCGQNCDLNFNVPKPQSASESVLKCSSDVSGTLEESWCIKKVAYTCGKEETKSEVQEICTKKTTYICGTSQDTSEEHLGGTEESESNFDGEDFLRSRDINKKSPEGKSSRLRLLEEKLREAGFGKEQENQKSKNLNNNLEHKHIDKPQNDFQIQDCKYPEKVNLENFQENNFSLEQKIKSGFLEREVFLFGSETNSVGFQKEGNFHKEVTFQKENFQNEQGYFQTGDNFQRERNLQNEGIGIFQTKENFQKEQNFDKEENSLKEGHFQLEQNFQNEANIQKEDSFHTEKNFQERNFQTGENFQERNFQKAENFQTEQNFQKELNYQKEDPLQTEINFQSQANHQHPGNFLGHKNHQTKSPKLQNPELQSQFNDTSLKGTEEKVLQTQTNHQHPGNFLGHKNHQTKSPNLQNPELQSQCNDASLKETGTEEKKVLQENLEVKNQKKPKKIIELLDKNENVKIPSTVEDPIDSSEEEEIIPQVVEITELGSPADLNAFLDDRFGGLCEFDVKKISTFSSGYGGNEFYVVYDELDSDFSEEDELRVKIYKEISNKESGSKSESKMRGDQNNSDPSAPKRHNPDHDNLKSLLKQPGRKEKKKNRVSFNETKNEFFDADYIILIREDCDYDEDEDDGICTCNQHEMVRLTCCEPDCNCNAYEEPTPQSPKYAPPLEFVDSVTLSPPEGYKDMDQRLLELQQLARQRGQQQQQLQQQAVCRECSGHHDSDSGSGSEGDADVEYVQQNRVQQQQQQQQLQQQQREQLQQQLRQAQAQRQQREQQRQREQQLQQQRQQEAAERLQQLREHQQQQQEQREQQQQQQQAAAQQAALEAQQQSDTEKTDQSQQTTPTTPPAECTPNQQRYIMETLTMTTVTEHRMVREVSDETSSPSDSGDRRDSSPEGNEQDSGIGNNQQKQEKHPPTSQPTNNMGSPITGILKGGKLWKQQSQDILMQKANDNATSSDGGITSDEEGNTLKRIVRFHENESLENKRDSCDGEAEKITIDETQVQIQENEENGENNQKLDNCNNSISPEAQEMMLTFKLGNHILISNNSLRPNSAVRQLFPSKAIGGSEKEGENQQFLVTAESLRAFEEAKRSKLPQMLHGDEESIRKTIERNALRRSLIRYEPRSKKTAQKTDNSLVERIKQLTCDVDDLPIEEERSSPTGEESNPISNSNTSKLSLENNLNNRINSHTDKSFSPSSSSTTSSNSSMSSTYKKITDLFGKRDKASEMQNNVINEAGKGLLQTAPDLGNGTQDYIDPATKLPLSNQNEARKQFLSTLAPLTACVGGAIASDEFQYQYQLANNPGERMSMASTAGTEYSLEDIDEVLKSDPGTDPADGKKIAPDVLAGTPSASESADELAMFVQQDASRIERIKKRYQPETTAEEDDEHDDYGFNRRPSVRGIKPRFGTTNEILQQIQNQLQPPTTQTQSQSQTQPQPQPRQANHTSWPYYSETGLDNPKTRTSQTYSTYSYPVGPPDMQRYRPTSLIEEGIYQNCPNQMCTQVHYSQVQNTQFHAPVVRIGGACRDLYSTLPNRSRTGRPASPPPMDMSRSYHQTMVLIPYNRIEGYQPGQMSPNPSVYSGSECNYAGYVTKKMPPNPPKRYPEGYGSMPRMPHPVHVSEGDYAMKMGQKPMVRAPYSTAQQPVQVHLMASRSESPLPGQFATARATQTPSATLSTCGYYPGPPNQRYRPAIGPVNTLPHNGSWNEGLYTGKINRHSFPASGPRYNIQPDNISLADSESQVSVNGYRTVETMQNSAPSSPTKARFSAERGVPEGAASVTAQDSTITTSTMTSPTSPQNPTSGKSMFYAMNV